MLIKEVGTIPISVSTAAAVEALFLENPEIKKDFKYTKESLWFNLRTLYRNLLGSINSEVTFTDEDLILDLAEEIKILLTVLSENNVKGKNKVVLYANDHNNLEKIFPYSKVKRPKTEKQILYFKRENRVLKTLLESLEPTEDYDVKRGNHILEGNDEEAIVLTHQPIDLLSRYRFSELHLLESHTGKIKRQSQWNTKLTSGGKLTRIPFNSFTLQLFGDNSTNFYSWSLGYKQVLTELAKSSNWNSLTGSEKFINDIMKVKGSNPVVYDLFENLLKTKMFF